MIGRWIIVKATYVFRQGVVSIASVGGATESSSLFLVEWVRGYATGAWRVRGAEF